MISYKSVSNDLSQIIAAFVTLWMSLLGILEAWIGQQYMFCCLISVATVIIMIMLVVYGLENWLDYTSIRFVQLISKVGRILNKYNKRTTRPTVSIVH